MSRHRRGRRHPVRRRRHRPGPPRRTSRRRGSCAARRRRSSSRSTRPTTRSASSGRPNSTRSAGRRRTRSRPRTGGGPATCSTRSCGRSRPRARPSSRARPARRRPRRGPTRSPPGTLEPFVVGEPEAGDADDTDGAEAPDLDGVDAEAARWDAAMAAEADGEPAAIAFVGRPNVGKSSLLNALLGRGAGDRLRGPGDDARRHRHPACLGPQRGRPHRHRRDPAARQGRVGDRPPSATRRCVRSTRCRGPTSPCSSSMPSRG